MSRRGPGRRLWPWLLPIIGTATAAGVWEVAARSGALPRELPAFSVVIGWLATSVADPALWAAFVQTIIHWGVGLLIGTAAGVVVGVIIGSIPLVSRLLQVPLEFLRPIPPIIYLPLLLLLAGAVSGVATGLAAVAAFWPVLFQTFYGVRSIEPLSLETGRVYGLSFAQQQVNIVLPSIGPFVATGIRIAASLSLVVAITMELVGGIPGLGATLRLYQVNGVYEGLYGLIIFVASMGLVLNLGLERLESRLLAWHQSHREVTP